MISEELLLQVEALTPEERHQLSVYLTKLELAGDADYWETVRRRAGEKANFVNVRNLG